MPGSGGAGTQPLQTADPGLFRDLQAQAMAATGLSAVEVAHDYHLHRTLCDFAALNPPDELVIDPSNGRPVGPWAFVGGTALASAHQIALRYSEDIDLVLFAPQGSGHMPPQRAIRHMGRQAAASANSAGTPKIRDFGNVVIIEVPIEDLIRPVKIDVSVAIPVGSPDDSGHHPFSLLPACSLMGRHADAAVLAAYPELGGFTVPAIWPQITAANKLSALHSAADKGDHDKLRRRGRDLYDLAQIADDPDLAAAVRATVANTAAHTSATTRIPGSSPRPETGYATSPAFTPGTKACEALEQGYGEMLAMVYGPRPAFAEAIEAARSLDS